MNNPLLKGRRHLRQKPGGMADIGSPPVGFWDREAKPGSALARLETAFHAGLEVYDTMQTRQREHAADGKLSPEGARHALRHDIFASAVPALHRQRQAIKSAKAHLEELKSKVKPPAPNKDEEVLRKEIREVMRSMPAKELDAFVTKNFDDPLLRAAVLEAPAWLSGISKSHRDIFFEQAVAAEHGEAIREINDLAHCIPLAERAVEAARSELQKESGLDGETFENLAAPIEQKQAAPWLKKQIIDGKEVVQTIRLDANGKTGTWQKATADEISTGIFASTHAEYETKRRA